MLFGSRVCVLVQQSNCDILLQVKTGINGTIVLSERVYTAIIVGYFAGK